MKEHRQLEYKQEMTDNFLKTVSAFANYDGGDIVFGVSDSGEITGIKDLDILCLTIENKINDTISPKPDFRIDTEPQKGIIKLHVSGGSHTPYYFRKRAYKRNDTSTIEVDDIELNRLILKGEHLSFEELRSPLQNLTFVYLEKRLMEEAGIQRLNVDILKTLSLYNDETGYNKAALILSDQNNLNGVDIARFGESMSIFLDREIAEGCSVLEAFDKTIEMFEKYYSYEEVTGSKREKFYVIPLEAFREALANAIVHRTWDVEARIRVSMFADRVEIASPGGLPYGLSRDEYLNGQVSIFRNPVLSNVFFRLNVIETFGTGIIKIKQAYEGLERKPLFNLYENSITVILPTQHMTVALTTDEESILDYLSGGRLASSSEIANANDFSKSKTIKLLKSMIEKSVVSIEGIGRGTKYRRV